MPQGVRSTKTRKVFLDWLEKGYSPSKAAKKAGEHLRFFRKWKEDDPNFAEDWEDAIETGSDALEDVATLRAKRGSDGLLTTLLKARRPDKFREKTNDVNVKINNVAANIDEELERKIAKALGEDPGGEAADPTGAAD